MKAIMSGLFALSFMTTATFAQTQDKDFNEDIFIFTGEVQNFLETAEQAYELNKEDLTEDQEKELEAKLQQLQSTARRIADAYFQTAEEANRVQFTEFLSTQFSAKPQLKNYYLFVGNAFAAEAQRVLDTQNSKLRRIQIWSIVGGSILGLAGGYLVFDRLLSKASLSTRLIAAGVTTVGIAAAVSGGGYYIRYILPIDPSVTNAEDFLTRYPHGEDYLKEIAPVSQNLAMRLKDLEEGDE